MDITITTDVITSLTAGEIEFIEEKSGKSINTLFENEASPKGTVLRALAYIVRRRNARNDGEAMPDWEDTFDDRVTLVTEEEGSTSRPPTSARRKRPAG